MQHADGAIVRGGTLVVFVGWGGVHPAAGHETSGHDGGSVTLGLSGPRAAGGRRRRLQVRHVRLLVLFFRPPCTSKQLCAFCFPKISIPLKEKQVLLTVHRPGGKHQKRCVQSFQEEQVQTQHFSSLVTLTLFL